MVNKEFVVGSVVFLNPNKYHLKFHPYKIVDILGKFSMNDRYSTEILVKDMITCEAEIVQERDLFSKECGLACIGKLMNEFAKVQELLK